MCQAERNPEPLEIRKSLDTRDWGKAQRIIREWEAEGAQPTEPEIVTVAEAWQQFTADAQAARPWRSICWTPSIVRSRRFQVSALGIGEVSSARASVSAFWPRSRGVLDYGESSSCCWAISGQTTRIEKRAKQGFGSPAKDP
jgi:hypothetical protein